MFSNKILYEVAILSTLLLTFGILGNGGNLVQAQTPLASVIPPGGAGTITTGTAAIPSNNVTALNVYDNSTMVLEFGNGTTLASPYSNVWRISFLPASNQTIGNTTTGAAGAPPGGGGAAGAPPGGGGAAGAPPGGGGAEDQQQLQEDQQQLQEDQQQLQEDQQQLQEDQQQLEEDQQQPQADEQQIQADEQQIQADEQQIQEDEQQIQEDEQQIQEDEQQLEEEEQ
jgi:hypothetical protein